VVGEAVGVIDALWPLLRPLLFTMDAERAHELTLRVLGAAPRAWSLVLGTRVDRPTRLGPLALGSPVGLAAGLDKDGVAIEVWAALGFGFVEVGTVTALPQPGNDRPRLHRLPEERALINRMGFNNHGSAALADRMRALREAGRWPRVPVGANIGKSKVTPLDEAADDYALSARRLAPVADYLTVNVSSPNTPGLRTLQDSDALTRILGAVLTSAPRVPVFVKLSPDLTPDAVVDAVTLARTAGVAGVITTNTTVRRDVLARDPGLEGGLSGAPLRAVARPAIDAALGAAGGLPVIGVGGLSTAAHASELLAAGCAAVQVYTAFIYEGPRLPRRMAG
jgi:dihydroorotate dehydrogenase